MADYEGYTSVFCGTIIGSQSEFDNALLRVNVLLKNFTDGRIDEYNGDDKDTAIYTLCEIYYTAIRQKAAEAEHAGIASENVDGYSVSYSGGYEQDAASKEFMRSLYVMARMYLPAHLFNRGV